MKILVGIGPSIDISIAGEDTLGSLHPRILYIEVNIEEIDKHKKHIERMYSDKKLVCIINGYQNQNKF